MWCEFTLGRCTWALPAQPVPRGGPTFIPHSFFCSFFPAFKESLLALVLALGLTRPNKPVSGVVLFPEIGHIGLTALARV